MKRNILSCSGCTGPGHEHLTEKERAAICSGPGDEGEGSTDPDNNEQE